MPAYRPTTRSQKEVYLALTQLQQPHFYNLVDTTVITGDFDVDRMRYAMRQLSNDLASLRGHVFYHDGDIVCQAGSDHLEIDYIDLSEDQQYEQTTRQLIDSYLHHDFDIKHSTLARFSIIKQPNNHWLFAEYGSHILLDGWTHALVYNRLVNSYNGEENEAPNTLDDILASEKTYLSGPDYPRDQAYWQAYCEQLPAPLKLAHEEAPAGPQVRTHQILNPALVKRLRALCHTRKLRISSVLLATFGLFFSKQSGQREFSVGLPVAGRIDRKTRTAPGMMSTIVPFGFSIAPDSTLQDIIVSVNRTLRHHLVHQRYHSEEMMRDIPPEQRGNALFCTTLNVLAYEQSKSFKDCQVRFKSVSNGHTTHLAVDLFDRTPDGNIEFNIAANGHLFTAEQIEQYASRFERLLAQVLDAPDEPVSHYSLLSDQERDAHAAYAARPERPFTTFNHYLAHQQRTQPQAVAVVEGDNAVTYDALLQKAHRLAGLLTEQGIRQGDCVGVMIPRSIDWVTCVVALYHLGVTYLPLHADLPDERLRYMLDDANAQLVICRDTARIESLAPGLRTVVFSHEAIDQAAPCAAAAVRPEDGAYLIYTSGSTGKPKGVLVPHEGLVDEFVAMQNACGITAGHRLMQCSAMSFDVSCLEVRLALLSGAALVITDHSVITGDSHALADFITHHGVTHLFMTPAVLGCHSAHAMPAHVTLFLTGEATPKALLERFSHCKQLINLYGPSEATVITINPQFSADNMSLGHVIDTMHVYVLDEQRRLMPPDSTGELFVTGTGLAKGYIGKPSMTAERFVPDLFHPDRMMYATGDRVYMDREGQLFYLGRKDGQIKLRGQRIELGEIRNALLSCPNVEEAHVLIESHGTLGQTLVAYLRAASPVSQEALKQQLRKTLPLYMVPNVIHTLKTLPLTPNGKLDMRRLSQYVEEQQQADATDEEAPANEAESVVCHIFSTVLQLPAPVSPDDDFFMMGGHSLLAFKVIHQVQEAFGVELNVADLMLNPTPRGIVAQLASDQRYDPLMPTLRLRAGSPDCPPIICLHSGLGIGWPYTGFLPYFPLEWPVYALQSASLRDSHYTPESVIQVAQDHLQRIRELQPHGPYHLVGWSMGGHVAYTIAALLQQQGETIASLVLIDSYPAESASRIYTHLQQDNAAALHQLRERLVSLVFNDDVPPEDDWLSAVDARFNINVARDGHLLDTFVQQLTHSIVMMQHHQPLRYNGDILLIEATAQDELRADNLSPSDWQDYITGEITTQSVPFLHEALLQSKALECYAEVLTDYIAARMT